jgi:antitoxin component YwqK of YwqJK toxin-antitoxin module
VKGVREGKALFWHANGQLGRQAKYKAGALVDQEYHWYENGQWKWQALYKEGKVVAQRAWTREGKLLK